MPRRAPDSPLFLALGAAVGLAGTVWLVAATRTPTPADLPRLAVLTLIALTLRLNTFTVPPRIVISLVSTVQVAAVVLVGGAGAAWISIVSFLVALVARRPRGVAPRIILAVVTFNVGMEALMTLSGSSAFRLAFGAADPAALSGTRLLTPSGIGAVVCLALALKASNEALMAVGSYLRGVSFADYSRGARRALAVELGMLPLGLLLALVGEAAGARGLALTAIVVVISSILVKRVSLGRDALERINVDLERRVSELDLLGRVGRSMSSVLELDGALEAIHKNCSELFDAGNFMIALLTPDGRDLELSYGMEGGHRLTQRRIPRGQGLVSLVIERRAPLLIKDLEREAAALPVRPVQVSPRITRSWLGVPLLAGEEILGVMVVQDERPDAYDENLVRLITTIATQVATTIQNTRLVRATVDRARLEQENRDLRLLDGRKNDFVNMVAHQLQAPLTAIIGFSDLVRSSPASPASTEHVATIHVESHRLSHLVEQLLQLSRIRSGRLSPVLRSVDLNAIAREVVDSHFPLLAERRVTVETDFVEGGVPVEADPALLHQAVANLFHNAIKYSPEGSSIRMKTSGPAGSSPAEARLAVEDSGPGVQPEERDRIFEEFYRSKRPGLARTPGSGLGLTIAKEIVEIHRGRITLEDGASGGSVFSLTLPVSDSPPAASRASS
jgi:signal transduction histidine kinase